MPLRDHDHVFLRVTVWGGRPYAYRLGRHLRYDPAEVRRWLAAGADHDDDHGTR